MEDRTETRYFLGTTATRSVIRYYHPSRPNTIEYCTTARFNEYETLDNDGKISPGSKITQGLDQDQNLELTAIHDQDNPSMTHPIETVTIKLPPKGKVIGIFISRCKYNKFPYISKSTPFRKQ